MRVRSFFSFGKLAPDFHGLHPCRGRPQRLLVRPAIASQTAVLNAWESAQQTLYGYLQAPWQQDRANLVAGQTAATLWPNLANYFVDPALKSEQTFLVGVKMGQLNGPTSFNLGTPKVSTLTPTTATVTGCIYDSGTTTATGKPGPASRWTAELAGYSGTWNPSS